MYSLTGAGLASTVGDGVAQLARILEELVGENAEHETQDLWFFTGVTSPFYGPAQGVNQQFGRCTHEILRASRRSNHCQSRNQTGVLGQTLTVAQSGGSVTVKLKRKDSYIGGADEVHMTLEDFGTNALHCDSVANISVRSLELIPQTELPSVPSPTERTAWSRFVPHQNCGYRQNTNGGKTPSASIANETGGRAKAIIKTSRLLMA